MTDPNGNNAQTLTDPWRFFAAADVDPAVFFVEAENPCLGKFGNIAHLKIGMPQKLFGGQGLGTGVDDDLAGDDIRDNAGHDSGGAFLKRTMVKFQAEVIVVNSGTYPNFGNMANPMGVENRWR